MPEQSNDYRVVVFGTGGVGKTSIIQRFVHGKFKENYVPTIEDTYRQVIACNKQVCTLHITDTAGAHQFPAMQKLSITNGHAFILVFSITSTQSIEELKPVYKLIREVKGQDFMHTPIMLVGNKTDGPTAARKMSEIDGRAMAKSWGDLGYIETSAKENINVTDLFRQLLKLEKRRVISLACDDQTRESQTPHKKTCSVM